MAEPFAAASSAARWASCSEPYQETEKAAGAPSPVERASTKSRNASPSGPSAGRTAATGSSSRTVSRSRGWNMKTKIVARPSGRPRHQTRKLLSRTRVSRASHQFLSMATP